MLSVHVLSVSCGAESTIALCQEGVYSWGSSTHGQLGHGDTLKRTRPVQVSSLAAIPLLTIKCGHYHCLALDENHRVWGWGWGIHGQLGLGISDDILTPTHATEMDNLIVSFIATGFNHSAIISNEGILYTFGNGMYGQLGHGSQDTQLRPCRVEALAEKVVYLVSCGTSHTLAVCGDQSVYHWGKNLHKPYPGSSPQSLKQYTRSRRDGAVSPAVSNALLPVLINWRDFHDIVIEIDCGNSHCLLLLHSGAVLSWGSNMHGQIGHTHIPELSQPKYISKLEDHCILSLCCGDDHSIAVDDAGISWVWGRDDLGQLGMEISGLREGKKVCIFAPNPNPQIPAVPFSSGMNSSIISRSPSGESSLQFDLGWSLPYYAGIDGVSSYGGETLSVALSTLDGYYRCTPIMYFCKNWNDWQSLVDIYQKQKQWQQATYWKLHQLTHTKQISLTKAVTAVKECFASLTSGTIHVFHTRDYIIITCKLLQQVFCFWEEHNLNAQELENVLRNFLPSLAYSLSILLKSCGRYFSYKFSIEVTSEIISKLHCGIPPVEEIFNSALPVGASLNQKQSFESSPCDCHLWTEVLRNIFKDLSKRDTVFISESQLSQFDVKEMKSLTVFSCGHTFTEKYFQRSVLTEFFERLHNLPQQITNFISFLLHYYKHSTNFSSACPYCIFHYLRGAQLQVCQNIAIRPWNP